MKEKPANVRFYGVTIGPDGVPNLEQVKQAAQNRI